MYRKILIIYFILCFTVLNANDLKKITLQLLWKHQFEFAGYYIAKEKGFYRDVGIDVNIKEYDFNTDISKDVSQGKSDFGIGSTSLIIDKINGLDIYLLAPLLQSSPLVLITKKRNDIKTVQDLKGKNIMLTQNQISMASLNAMLKINNLSKKDFLSKKHSFNIENLLTGDIDAMSVYLTNEPYYLLQNNVEFNIFNPNDFGFEFYEDILFTSTKLLKNEPELVKKFYEATIKGWTYAFNNIEESAQLIMEKYNTQNKSLNHLIYEANQLKNMAHFDSKEFGKFKLDIINQIIQTYNLLDISKSVLNLEDFIYPDALYKENNINFSFLIKITISFIIIMSVFYYWNRKLSNLNKRIEKNQEKILLLLNNTGQGFLTFKNDFKVDNEYSKECQNIFGKNIEYQDIRTLLFTDEKNKINFTDALSNALDEKMEIKRKSYLSLLPNIILLNKKAIKLEYKILNNTTFMLILTNVTLETKLENKIKKEQELFKMIVTVVNESRLFFDLITEYENFINSKIKNLDIQELYRIIHTFKGTFSQLFMEEIVKSLHSFESTLAKIKKENLNNHKKLYKIVENHDFKTSFYETKKLIVGILGDEFLESNKYIKIDKSNILDLQYKISDLIGDKASLSPKCKEIFIKIQNLSKKSLYNLLKANKLLVKELAQRFHKEVEFIIDGDREYLVKENIEPFIKSLVHVFRNNIDHGIETPDEREAKNKKKIGLIICKFKEENNRLHIIISDDGKGLDIPRIKQIATTKGMDITSLNESEIYKIILNNNFSTKIEISEISGRGVGMSVVKNELENLNGHITVTSQKDIGTKFEFVIPL
jgi:ABC-type nitrate/sulfonate/bicarbonate transport system substrate-binding protein